MRQRCRIFARTPPDASPLWRRSSRPCASSGRTPLAHTRGPSEPSPPLASWRESLENRPLHGHLRRPSDCSLVDAASVVQFGAAVTTEFRARASRNARSPVLPS
jgi:hypothetical protein